MTAANTKETGVYPLAATPEERDLLHAALNHLAKRVSFLLEGGVNPNVYDEKGRTALHIALESKQLSCARELLANGADPNVKLLTPEPSEEERHMAACTSPLAAGRNATPLHIASLQNLPEATNLLLQHGALPDLGDATGSTPLHLAAFLSNTDCLRALLEGNANPNLTGREGMAPLHYATAMGFGEYEKCVAILLAHKADSNLPTPFGDSVLHQAARAANPKVVRLLLLNGAAPNARDRQGDTALHIAALDHEVGSLLVRAGADPKIKNHQGFSPHDIYAAESERAREYSKEGIHVSTRKITFEPELAGPQ